VVAVSLSASHSMAGSDVLGGIAYTTVGIARLIVASLAPVWILRILVVAGVLLLVRHVCGGDVVSTQELRRSGRGS
jgi:hypothetical protein